MKSESKVVLSWVGTLLGAVVTAFGFVLEAYEVAQIGLTASQWQAVGAVVFLGSVIVLLVKHQQSHEAFKREIRESAQPREIEPIPTTSSTELKDEKGLGQSEKGENDEEGVTPTIEDSTAVSLESSSERIILEMPVEELMQKAFGLTDYQLRGILPLYAGKWLKVSGYLADVSSGSWGNSGIAIMQVALRHPEMDTPRNEFKRIRITVRCR